MIAIASQQGRSAGAPVKVLALGDSLTAGYGLPYSQSFTSVLEELFHKDGLEVELVNGGLSGDTSGGALARLDWLLEEFGPAGPDVAVVELGANDALRGMDPANLERNLDAILAKLKARGALVLLAGMYAPASYGPEYGERFRAVYPRLAERRNVALYPFFLDGVAGDPALNQADGIHPNARGAREVARRIYPRLKELVEKSLAERP